MKLFPTLRPRERRFALVAIGLFLCWMLVLWVVEPLWHRVSDLRQRTETQLTMAQELNSLLAEAPQIARQYEALGGYLAVQSAEVSRGALFNELEGLSRSANVQLSLKPLPLKEEERLARFPVEIDIEGSPQSVLTFLDSLFRLPKLLVIDRLRLSAVPAKEDQLRANIVLQQLTLR